MTAHYESKKHELFIPLV